MSRTSTGANPSADSTRKAPGSSTVTSPAPVRPARRDEVGATTWLTSIAPDNHWVRAQPSCQIPRVNPANTTMCRAHHM